MKLSSLLIVLSGLLAATTMKWALLWDHRTIGQIYRDAKSGKSRSSTYARIVAPISIALMIAGIYLALTWR